MPRAVKEWWGKTDDTPPPPRVKLRIWNREDGRCYLTGKKIMPGDKFQYEHKIAICNGGANRESNIFLALDGAHKEKSKADVAEKSYNAKRAKSNIGARTAPTRKINSPDFQQSQKKAARAARREQVGRVPRLAPRAIYEDIGG